MTQTLLPIHIAAGGLAIVFGGVALIAKKGGAIHRRIGTLFVYAMLVMGFSASILGFLKSPTDSNVRAGFLVAYFVVTAVTAVRPATRWTRRLNAAALAIAVVLALFAIVGSVRIFNLPGRTYDGVPFFAPLIIATVLLLGAAGDLRILRNGMLRGGKRLARHLWRMCFALFVAAGSFFSIRERVARVLPEPFTSGPMRALPIVLLFGAMVYWLWRCSRTTSAIPSRDATASIFDQRHAGRLLRSSGDDRGRGPASSRGGESGPGRCPPLWPGDLRNDGGGVAAAGADGGEA